MTATDGVIATAFCLLLPGLAAAQEPPPQPVQELFLTETVYPQEKGEFQFTLGSLVDRSGPGRSALTPIAIEYGLTDRWQIEMSWEGYALDSDWPFSHMHSARVTFATKYSFMHIAHSRVHAAVSFDAEFPDGDAAPFVDGDGGAVEMEPGLSLAIDLSRRVTVFGAGRASIQPGEGRDILNGEPPDDPGTLSVGGLVAFHYASFALEYANRSDGLPWRLEGAPLLTPSVMLHPGRAWELGVGMPVGVRAGTRQPSLAINIIKEF